MSHRRLGLGCLHLRHVLLLAGFAVLVIAMPFETTAVQYAYIEQYSDSSCGTFAGAEAIDFDGQCTTHFFQEGDLTNFINCSSAGVTLVPYSTIDCTGPVLELPDELEGLVNFTKQVCTNSSATRSNQFLCIDEPTVFLYKSFAFGTACSGEPDATTIILSSTVCLSRKKVIQLTETTGEMRAWAPYSTCTGDPDYTMEITFGECIEDHFTISLVGLNNPPMVTSKPSANPTTSRPSRSPSTSRPSRSPSTSRPSHNPSRSPINSPSRAPSRTPTRSPSKSPSSARSPSQSPSKAPSIHNPASNLTSAPSMQSSASVVEVSSMVGLCFLLMVSTSA